MGNFEEIEVEHGRSDADVQEDEEILDDNDVFVSRIGVPARHFWIVGVGLSCSTILLLVVLYWLLQVPPRDTEDDESVTSAALLAAQVAKPMLDSSMKGVTSVGRALRH